MVNKSRNLYGFRRSNVGGAVRSLAILFFCLILGQFIFSSSSCAAEAGKYQIVAGSGDNAYLLDTETGAVWVLTYRTMATGREPVAIPYKFIGISPKSRNEFLMEMSPGAPSTAQGHDK